MYSPQFTRNLNDILSEIRKSKTLKYLNDSNFVGKERAQVELEVLKIATQSALSITELELKNKQLALDFTRAKLEAETNLVANKINLLNAMAQNLKAMIECFVLKQSVFDNAYINRANILATIANIWANGADVALARTALNLATKHAEQIGAGQARTSFDDILTNLKTRAEQTFAYGTGAKDAIIIAGKKVIKPNEEVHILGLSIFGQNESEFLLNDNKKIGSGGEIDFISQDEGEYKITYRVKDNNNRFVSDSLIILVKNQEIKE